jgi:uncharacterized repeat protein (TIGR01451 family)
MARFRVLFLVLIAVASATVSAQLVVTPSNTQGWQFQTSDSNALTLPPPSVFLAPGFEMPPLGSGSLHFSVGPDGGDAAQARQPGYNLVRLDQLTALSYSTFTEVDGSGDQAPYIILNLDHNGDTTLDDQIFFEPVYQSGVFFPSNPQGPLVDDTWQNWNALTGGWWSVNNLCAAGPGINVKSLATYIACFPNARILNGGTGLGGVRIVTGFGAGAWNDYLGAADNFTIGVSGVNTTYDFEPAAAQIVTVTTATPDGWTFQVVDDEPDGITTGTITIVPGPGTPPLGDGSLQFNLGTEGEDGVQARNINYDGQYIRDLAELTYSTYVQQPGSDTQAPYIILDIDLNNDGVRDDLWFFEPAYQTGAFCPSNPQAAVATGSWQTWNAINGCWYSVFGTAGTGPGINVRPLSVLLDAEPDARLSTNITGGSFRIVTGFGDLAWDNFIGNADAVDIAFGPTETIYDFEPIPSITINDAAMNESTAGTINLVFNLTLSEAVSQTVTVDFTTADNTATAADPDYVPITGTATFTPGTTTTSVTVVVVADNKFEQVETMFLNLSNPQFATLADNQAVGTIVNDDPMPNINVNDQSLAEGNGGTTNMVFTVILTNPSYQTVTVNYTTNPGTADEGPDYIDVTGVVTFVPGDTSETINIPINGDTVFEPNETFTIDFTNPVNAVGDTQAIGTILNDDPQPTISFLADVAQLEGNAGTTPFVFTVNLSNASQSTVTVNYTTNPGTATEGVDYADSTGTLTFVPGDTSETITVNVNGDVLFEADETFAVDLSVPVNAAFTDDDALGTIQNDDGAPTIVISDVTLPEGNAGITPFTFTVTLTNASASTVTVNYTTNPGTATEGADYADNTGTVTFVPGDTSETITVNVTGDLVFEPTETFFVDLSVPVNATLADNQGLGTIQNDEGTADVSITKTGPANVQSGDPVTYTITVTNNGPSTASNVVVTDVIPTNTTFVSATPTQGNCTGTTTVTCTLGAIADDGTATITLVVTAPQSGTFNNTATVANAPEFDPTPNNNAGSAFAFVGSSDIPTLSEWALLALLAGLLALAVAKLR